MISFKGSVANCVLVAISIFADSIKIVVFGNWNSNISLFATEPLEYITDIKMRETIQAATCKSESFNDFVKWVFFFNNGEIQENLRHEQNKMVYYNHLVANLVILHNVNAMTKVIRRLRCKSASRVDPPQYQESIAYRVNRRRNRVKLACRFTAPKISVVSYSWLAPDIDLAFG